ncbi:hypothetical protein [Microbacterium enclense]|uniref:hypothetical protein n=1 Tax=Microbacterium enclense TaxID=993073 RepID=UPI003F817F01
MRWPLARRTIERDFRHDEQATNVSEQARRFARASRDQQREVLAALTMSVEMSEAKNRSAFRASIFTVIAAIVAMLALGLQAATSLHLASTVEGSLSATREALDEREAAVARSNERVVSLRTEIAAEMAGHTSAEIPGAGPAALTLMSRLDQEETELDAALDELREAQAAGERARSASDVASGQASGLVIQSQTLLLTVILSVVFLIALCWGLWRSASKLDAKRARSLMWASVYKEAAAEASKKR